MTLSVERLRRGDRREIAQWLSAADQGSGVSKKQWDELKKSVKDDPRPVIGLSGPPGAGKSSLIGQILETLSKNMKILVLCIDPSSPVTGGAVLGDRIRMEEHGQNANRFVRSLGSHGFGGGICPNLDKLILIGQAAQFDLILVESVGAGQGEYALRDYVDTFVVVLVPEAGDEIQAMKAGSLELADVVILNKSDRPGSDQLWGQLEQTLVGLKLFRTSVVSGEGIRELATYLGETRAPSRRKKR